METMRVASSEVPPRSVKRSRIPTPSIPSTSLHIAARLCCSGVQAGTNGLANSGLG